MPTCFGCGAIYKDDEKVCPYCGRPNPQPNHIIFQKEAEIISPLSCPLCHHTDSVYKASELRRQQTSRLSGFIPVSQTFTNSQGKVSSYTSFSGFSGTQISDLAKALEPPTKPREPKEHSLWMIIGILALGWVGLQAVICVLAGMKQDASAAIFGVVLLGVVIAGFLWWRNRYKKQSEEYKINLEKYNRDQERWTRAINRWENLYYCVRDGVIFIPGNSSYAYIDKLIDFIYSD